MNSITTLQNDPRVMIACDYLETHGLSGNFIKNLLQKTTDGVTIAFFEKDETVFSRSSYFKALGIVVSGSLTSHKTIAGGDLSLRNLDVGDVFGLAGLFGSAPSYVSTIYARTNAVVVFFSEDFLKTMFQKYPECAISYIELLSQKIRYLNAKIDSFATPNAYSKLALYLYEHQGYSGSMTLLANTLGMSRMTLYRNLDALIEEGIIQKNGKKIVLVNADIAGLFSSTDELL